MVDGFQIPPLETDESGYYAFFFHIRDQIVAGINYTFCAHVIGRSQATAQTIMKAERFDTSTSR